VSENNAPVEVYNIVDIIPAKLLASKLGVTERVVNFWKHRERGISEQNQRKILKLKDLAKRVENGSYESYSTKGLGIQLNVIKFDLPLKTRYQDIAFIGDVHDGYPTHNRELYLKSLRYCSQFKIPIIFMGDINEYGMPNSPGTSKFTQDPVNDQIKQTKEDLKPLVDAGLVKGWINGNHESRIMNITGVDISELICDSLKIPYLRDACWNAVRVGGQWYSVYTIHGSSGAIYTETKLGYYMKMSNNFDCDLLVGAHVHELANTEKRIQSIDFGRLKVVEKVKSIAITGSYIEYSGSYGMKKGWAIPQLGSCKARFYTDEHKITIHNLFAGKESKPTEWKEEK